MKDSSDYPAFTSHQLSGNILHITLKKVKKLMAKDVEDIYECFRLHGGDNGVFVIVSFSGFIPPSDDAMIEAKKQSNQKYVNAMVYVISSAAPRLGVKFFMNFYKPKYSTDIFATQKQAMDWILKEKKKQGK